MELADKNMTCTECGGPFVFTAGEQQFYQEKGFQHEPRRCRDCRSRKRGEGPSGGAGPSRHSRGSGGGGGRGGDGGSDRQHYSAVCSKCGGPAKLSFEPSPDRPVFCRTCFQARQTERSYR
jgi:CxxC-x17-CxxC domain-containing protein